MILPGGFAYGAYLRAPALAKFAPIMSAMFGQGGSAAGPMPGRDCFCVKLAAAARRHTVNLGDRIAVAIAR